MKQGADGGDHVPEPPAALEAVGGIAARHPGQTEEVHREEGQVEAEEGQPELQLAQPLIEQLAEEPSASRSRCPPMRAKMLPPNEDVVEVGDDEVGVILLGVDRDDRVHDAGEPADDEL